MNFQSWALWKLGANRAASSILLIAAGLTGLEENSKAVNLLLAMERKSHLILDFRITTLLAIRLQDFYSWRHRRQPSKFSCVVNLCFCVVLSDNKSMTFHYFMAKLIF
jgi:hypothetical protein